jgi:hypothetical protein
VFSTITEGVGRTGSGHLLGRDVCIVLMSPENNFNVVQA